MQRRQRLAALDDVDSVFADPAITVVQPILSGDPNLREMLRRSIDATSSSTHFLWMVDDQDETARQVCEELAVEFPGRGRLEVCGAAPIEENPKVFKLRIAVAKTDAEFFVVLDDDTCIDAETLDAAMVALNDCHLVTGLPGYEPSVGEPSDGFWSSLVAHFVNNNSVMTYLPLLNFRDPISINGMFYVVRSDTLKQHDPFCAIRHQVCDDYALAKFFRDNNLPIRQLICSQRLITHVESAAAYRRLMHRWMVFANCLVQDQTFVTQLILFVLLGMPAMLLWISMFSILGGWSTSLLLVATLANRHILIRILHAQVLGWFPAFSWWQSICAELLQPIQLIGAFLNPRIIWRGKPVRIGRDGSFVKPPEIDGP